MWDDSHVARALARALLELRWSKLALFGPGSNLKVAKLSVRVPQGPRSNLSAQAETRRCDAPSER